MTHNDSFVWGYNGVPFVLRESEHDKFFVEYGKLTRQPLSWKEECIETARLIYETSKEHNEIPFVLFSGGLDSQVVVEAFRLSGVPFNVVTIRFNDDWNWHDIKFAIEWCQTYNIKQTILDIDLVHFLENDVLDIGIPCQAHSPQYCVFLWGMNQVEGFPVTSFDGEPELSRSKDNLKKCFFIQEEIHLAAEKHFMCQERKCAPSFYNYTSELKISHLIDSETLNFANCVKYNEYTDNNSWFYGASNFVNGISVSTVNSGYTQDLQCHKNNYYRHYFPDFKVRPQITSRWRRGHPYTDYNGFEFMPEFVFQLENNARTELQKRLHDTEEIWMDYDECVFNMLDGYEDLHYEFRLNRE